MQLADTEHQPKPNQLRQTLVYQNGYSKNQFKFYLVVNVVVLNLPGFYLVAPKHSCSMSQHTTWLPYPLTGYAIT